MSEEEFNYDERLDAVLVRDSRYAREAYFFVQRALHHYREGHVGGAVGGHISGPQVLKGVRALALEEFGPLARTVLNSWGLKSGEDVGEAVYNLIEIGLMSKTKEDRKDDFAGIMVFDESMDADSHW